MDKYDGLAVGQMVRIVEKNKDVVVTRIDQPNGRIAAEGDGGPEWYGTEEFERVDA